MRKSWAASRLLAILPLSIVLTVACVKDGGGGAVAPSDPEVRRVVEGWMGRFSRRDQQVASLLASNPGWGHLRDMRLFEAVQYLEGGDGAADRIGAARSYLALAEYFASLDALLLEVESSYLDSLGPGMSADHRIRRALVSLRRGDAGQVSEDLEALGGSAVQGPARTVCTAGLAVLEGRTAEAAGILAAAGASTAADRTLAEVARYVWALPAGQPGTGPYHHAIDAFRHDDLAGGVLSLQMMEFTSDGRGALPELFLYELLRRAFSGLAVRAVSEQDGAWAAYVAGRALTLLGDDRAAAERFGVAAKAAGDAVAVDGLFSPVTGAAELSALSKVLRGACLFGSGDPKGAASSWRDALGSEDPGPLVRAALVGLQVRFGQDGPLETSAELPLLEATLEQTPPGFPEGEEGGTLLALYAARRAEISRWLARAHWGARLPERALDAMERSHRKSSGYRPDFVNPPTFLADLGLAYARVGVYAPAVAILFDLSDVYPATRLGYESLKRLYASRTGGEVPPR